MKLEDFLIEEEGDDSRHLPNGELASTWDSVGHVWNIGPGLTHGITKSTVWTPEQLQAAEGAEFSATRAAVAHLVQIPLAELGENRTTVLESFTYNVGVHGFATSSVLRAVNSRKFDEVTQDLRRWNKAAGKVSRGLINRREAEIRLWLHPDSEPARADLSTSRSAPCPDHPDIRTVAWLQESLNKLQNPTQPLDADNVPGPRTRAAVRLFQKEHGLIVDGVAGPKTIAEIEAALNPLPAAA